MEKIILNQQEFRAAVIIDAIPDPVCISDLDHNFIGINLAMEDLFELPIETLLTMKSSSLTSELEFSKLSDTIKLLMQTGTPQQIELTGNLGKAKDRIFLLNMSLLKDKKGRPAAIVSVAKDLTEYKKVSSKLQNSMEELKISNKNFELNTILLQNIINSIPARVFWKDLNLRFLGCNKPFAQDAGLSKPEELIGKNDYEMSWKNQAELYRKEDMAVIESGKSNLNFVEQQRTPDGSEAWTRTSKVPLHDRDYKVIGIMGIYDDITEPKKTQSILIENNRRLQKTSQELYMAKKEIDKTNKKLIKSNEKLKKANQTIRKKAKDIENAVKTKSRLLAAMSHEIRTPLNAVMGSARLLADLDSVEETRLYIDIIETSGNLLLGIINNVLDYSRIEANMLTILSNQFSLNNLQTSEVLPKLNSLFFSLRDR